MIPLFITTIGNSGGGAGGPLLGTVVSDTFDPVTTATFSFQKNGTSSSTNYNTIRFGAWNWYATISDGTFDMIATWDIPAELQGSTAELQTSVQIGDYSSAGNNLYWWYGVDGSGVETLITGGHSWEGTSSSMNTFANTGLVLPSDAVKIRLEVRTHKTGIGVETTDTRVDNVLVELVAPA